MSYDVSYYSFSPSRADKNWLNFETDLSENQELKPFFLSPEVKPDDEVKVEDLFEHLAATPENESKWLPRSEKEDQCYEINFYLKENNIDEKGIMYSLQLLDIAYGSVAWLDYFTNNSLQKCEWPIYTALFNAYNHTDKKFGDSGSYKDFLIKLFTSLNTKLVEDSILNLNKELDWESTESREAIMVYLKSVRPVAKDLKETRDSIFVGLSNGDFYPEESGKILSERAKQHYEIYIKPKLT